MRQHRRYCAFSFPAVLQTIGPGRWPEVREVSHQITSRQIIVELL